MSLRAATAVTALALVGGVYLNADRPLDGEASTAQAVLADHLKQGPAGYVRCAVSDLTPEEAERVELGLKGILDRNGFDPTLTTAIGIPTVVHVIYEGQTLEQGYVPESMIVDQITVLNDAYAGCGVSFRLQDITYTYEPRWYHMEPGSAAETEAKTALNVDPNTTFNVYTAELGGGLLGWATFPWSLESAPDMDGVVILNTSLPGGSAAPYDLGNTLTHEAGHWLGLYHTFQGGCLPQGDEVFDTAPERRPAYGCPESRDSCLRMGTDPVNNYMDYVDDACMFEFSQGQCTRIKQMVSAYRPAFQN